MELFAGIGGFGLAGEWAGVESTVQVEWNPFCQKVLAKNFPNAQRFGDITKFDGKPFRGAIDLISGGFPCQPYSTAGKRLGKEDDRHLWPEMLRIIQEVAPRWVVGENVRGIVSWNGGMVFDEAQADLELAGYEVQAFLLPACGVDAPHRRERIWFVAHSKENTCNDGTRNERSNELVASSNATEIRFDWNDWELAQRKQRREWRSPQYKPNGDGRKESATNPKCQTCAAFDNEWSEHKPQNWNEIWAINRAGCSIDSDSNEKRWEQSVVSFEPGSKEFGSWRNNAHGGNFAGFPSQPPVCGGNDGVSNRVDRIAALGNAIVPQVAFQIFKAIIEYEKL